MSPEKPGRFKRGHTDIRALIKDLGDIEGSSELYLHIHNEGPQQGIMSIADLADRILEPEEYQKKWIGFCSNWFEENRIEDDKDI